MGQILPVVPSVVNYSFNAVLDFQTYIFSFRWNSRDNAWYMDIADQNEVLIISGVKILLGAMLGRRSNHRFFTDGALIAVDTQRSGIEPKLDDFGTRVELRYYTGFDLVSILVNTAHETV